MYNCDWTMEVSKNLIIQLKLALIFYEIMVPSHSPWMIVCSSAHTVSLHLSTGEMTLYSLRVNVCSLPLGGGTRSSHKKQPHDE